ncbi:MAG: PorV/PorQ family protein [candidate division KSB1 bacterium]|nr:PorV/PorQ family protein [candidate division KSB1 bacterium]MDZ7319480.1 PorV/PorQ family protein [candidate division KSB1 bacterium]MDZ7340517.1 PorV/PorQ family protein [candidate division KSB1 bacterium]
MKNAKLLCSWLYLLLALQLLFESARAQNEGFAGTHSNFRLGVGARALALGNAYVAEPADATTIYWNPAGLDFIQRKNVSLFYTNLLAGSQYYFLGYVHPTIAFGTLGVGLINIGVGGIEETDENAVSGGIATYSNYQLLFSYGKQLPWDVAVGLNLKIDHQDFSNFLLTDVGTSATGIGADVGILYRPSATSFLMRGLSLGLTVQNLVGSRLKMDTGTDAYPINVRFGVAKPIIINEWGNQWAVFMDLEQGAKEPFRFHFGTEYVFQNMAMLRLGLNNNQVAFGAGAAFSMFQLDYSFGKFAPHELSSSHRLSVTLRFGKTKDELIKLAEERRFQEARQMAEQQVIFERNNMITESMDRGKAYLKDGAYEKALPEFSFVLKHEAEMPDADVIREAKKLYEEAEKKRDEIIAEKLSKIQAQNAAEAKRKQDEIELNKLFEQGYAYFQVEDYERAIEEWNKMLAIDPQHKLAQEYLNKAKADREKKILSLFTQADNYARNGRLIEAIRELNKARAMNPEERQVKFIEQRINQYENQMDFLDLIQQGFNYYLRKEYQNAMVAFKKALVFAPNDETVKEYFADAEARANARKEPMTEEVKAKYYEGYKLFTAGKYEEALKIWKAIQKKQPYNKQILDAIDSARDKLDLQKKGSKKQP